MLVALCMQFGFICTSSYVGAVCIEMLSGVGAAVLPPERFVNLVTYIDQCKKSKTI